MFDPGKYFHATNGRSEPPVVARGLDNGAGICSVAGPGLSFDNTFAETEVPPEPHEQVTDDRHATSNADWTDLLVPVPHLDCTLGNTEPVKRTTGDMNWSCLYAKMNKVVEALCTSSDVGTWKPKRVMTVEVETSGYTNVFDAPPVH